MAREVINVGAAPNDGQGDPIRTAYIKTNNNFAELYSAVQLVPPSTLLGSAGNKAGMIAYSPTAFYYCFQDYDGSSEIWGELPLAQDPPSTLLGSAGNKAGMIAYSPTAFYYCFQDYDGSSEIWGELLTGVTGSEILNGTSNVSVTASSNVTVSIAGVSNVAVFYANGFAVTGNVNVSANVTTGNVSGTTGTFTGNVTAGNLSVGIGEITMGNIVNANGNGIGNIGSSTLYFNTVFAQATSVQYADLAEMYQGDRYYSPGTVLSFGGSNEVTIAEKDHDVMVAGIVSTRPAYTMNSTLTGPTAVAIALAGRVPCNVQGPVLRGQMLVTAGNGRARAELNPVIGTVIGKALQDFDGSVGVIEIVVGRL